jgi:hypothetical protein
MCGLTPISLCWDLEIMTSTSLCLHFNERDMKPSGLINGSESFSFVLSFSNSRTLLLITNDFHLPEVWGYTFPYSAGYLPPVEHRMSVKHSH